MAKKSKTLKSYPELAEIAKTSYLLIVLIIVCFFLMYTLPEAFNSFIGNAVLLLFVIGAFTCGKMYGGCVAFVILVFTLYVRKHTNIYEGMEGKTLDDVLKKRNNPQQNQFLSINKRGNIIATKIEDGGKIGDVPPPVPLTEPVHTFTWTSSTMTALQNYAKKSPRWVQIFKKRYQNTASNEDVIAWLSSSPNLWPWTHETEVQFTQAVKKVSTEFNMNQLTPEQLKKLVNDTRKMFTERDTKQLISTGRLLTKWIKYMIESRRNPV